MPMQLTKFTDHPGRSVITWKSKYLFFPDTETSVNMCSLSLPSEIDLAPIHYAEKAFLKALMPAGNWEHIHWTWRPNTNVEQSLSILRHLSLFLYLKTGCLQMGMRYTVTWHHKFKYEGKPALVFNLMSVWVGVSHWKIVPRGSEVIYDDTDSVAMAASSPGTLQNLFLYSLRQMVMN